MSKIYFIFILNLTLLGCGNSISFVEDEFVPYYSSFIEEGESRSPEKGLREKPITIKFGPVNADEGYTEDETLGGCEIRSIRDDGSVYWGTIILINQKNWDSLNEEEKELVIFHELGHCLLNRQHKTASFSSGVNKSIMHPHIMDSSRYKSKRDFYLDELFLND